MCAGERLIDAAATMHRRRKIERCLAISSGFFLPIARRSRSALAQGIAGQYLGDLHHLFLIEDHAVGRFEYRLQRRVRVADCFLAVLALDEVIDHARLQRAGPEQRHQRDDVLETVRLQPLDQVLHAARFQLEDGGGLAALEQLEGLRIVHRQGLHRYRERRLRLARAAVNGLQSPSR